MLNIPSALKVVMIGDQLTYLKVAFYNSNYFKPNGSASVFGKTRLNNTKLRSVVIEFSSRSPRNTAPHFAGYSNPDAFEDFFE